MVVTCCHQIEPFAWRSDQLVCTIWACKQHFLCRVESMKLQHGAWAWFVHKVCLKTMWRTRALYLSFDLEFGDSSFAFWRKGLAKDCWGLVCGWTLVKTSFVQFAVRDVKEVNGGLPEIIPWDRTRQIRNHKACWSILPILLTQWTFLSNLGHPKDGPKLGHEHLLVERASHWFLNSDLPTIIWDHLGSFFWSKSSPIPKRPLVRVPRSCWPPVKMIIHSIRSYFVHICSNFWKQLVRTIVGAIGAIWSNMEQHGSIFVCANYSAHDMTFPMMWTMHVQARRRSE